MTDRIHKPRGAGIPGNVSFGRSALESDDVVVWDATTGKWGRQSRGMPIVNVAASFSADYADFWTTHRVTAASVTLTLEDDSDIPRDAEMRVLCQTSSLTVAQGTGVTLRWLDGGGGFPPTGNRTVAQAGHATIQKFTDTVYYIWGIGVS